MELKIKNTSSRVLLERSDNGVILYDIDEENNVTSKVVYEIYMKDGIIDFHNMATFMVEVIECLAIPASEISTNRAISIAIVKIDPSKPSVNEDTEDDQ